MDAPREFGIVDIDQHYYEPDDCCTRHVETKFADRVPQPRTTSDGARGARLQPLAGRRLGYAYRDRLFAPPFISLHDIDESVLDRVLALGARMVLIRTGPVAGRSPADPHFDRFWARGARSSAVISRCRRISHPASTPRSRNWSMRWASTTWYSAPIGRTAKAAPRHSITPTTSRRSTTHRAHGSWPRTPRSSSALSLQSCVRAMSSFSGYVVSVSARASSTPSIGALDGSSTPTCTSNDA